MSVRKETINRGIFYLVLFGIAGYTFSGEANPTCSISCAYRSELSRNIAFWGGLVATAGTAFFVLAYWLYTLKDKAQLRPLLRWPRTIWFALPLGIFPLVAFWLHMGVFAALNMVAFVVLDLYAYRRQWLDGYSSAQASASEAMTTLSEDALFAVVPDGRAVSIAELERARLITVPGSPRLLFVHCRLSRGLSVFAISGDAMMRASLPHATGFILRCDQAKEHWDGVDGRPFGEHAALEMVGVRVHSRGEVSGKQSIQFFTAEAPVPDQVNPPCTPRLPGSQDMENPMDWGIVHANQWTQNYPEDQGAGFYLARWAAHKRGITILPELI